MKPPAIVLFRRDLRLSDNPALSAAAAEFGTVLPVFVLDDEEAHAPGGAARWWLHHSLLALGESIAARGGALILRRGRTTAEIDRLVLETGARSVFWNRRYASEHVEADTALKSRLSRNGLDVRSFNGALLREPWELKTKSNGHFRVFTPFWKALLAAGPSRDAMSVAPDTFASHSFNSDDLASWALTPSKPDWAAAFPQHWTPGENGAAQRLHAFLDHVVAEYADHRDRPDIDGTSRLSPHLAFGEISPLQIWLGVHQQFAANTAPSNAAMKFLSEVAWREFAHVLLFHYPRLHETPIRKEFESFPWTDNSAFFKAWTRGETGYPIVDAGMRQLWTTGWMHNRVRMIVASFLVKHLLIPWQQGERWFWDTLVDADPANNAASWQWTAGCGADAAPYFRIFNPITQGERFDPLGAYTRKFVPELSGLPDKLLQQPWSASDEETAQAGVALGDTYPAPVVDHREARANALAAFESIKK